MPTLPEASIPSESDLPIDPNDVENIRSRQMLMICHDERVIDYRWPFDTRSGLNIDLTRAELGKDAVMPTAPGVYYFFWITNDEGVRVPVILAEGEVKSAMLVLGVKAGMDVADRLWYREGVLPRR